MQLYRERFKTVEDIHEANILSLKTHIAAENIAGADNAWKSPYVKKFHLKLMFCDLAGKW